MKLETKKQVVPVAACENVACDMGEVHTGELGVYQDFPYTHRVDDDLAVERAKHRVRTHAELAADKVADPTLGSGVSFRMPMAGQCENDQFPYRTDAYGKQIT